MELCFIQTNKWKNFKDLFLTLRVDYYCEKSIISVIQTHFPPSLYTKICTILCVKMNIRQGYSFFKINVEKYDYLLGFCTQQNSALLQMLIFLPMGCRCTWLWHNSIWKNEKIQEGSQYHLLRTFLSGQIHLNKICYEIWNQKNLHWNHFLIMTPSFASFMFWIQWWKLKERIW